MAEPADLGAYQTCPEDDEEVAPAPSQAASSSGAQDLAPVKDEPQDPGEDEEGEEESVSNPEAPADEDSLLGLRRKRGGKKRVKQRKRART